MWTDMLKFGLECDNITFAKEIKVKNTVSPPPSVPLEYNRLYDIDKMISPSSTEEQSKPETEAVTFCQKDERKPMVLRFPSRTLSEKVATNKPPEIALGVEDPSQLPVQFRPVPFHAPQPVTSTLQHQNQLRLTRPAQFSTSTANTFRLIRDVNPAARSSQQYLYPSSSRHGTPSILLHSNPRSSLPYNRPLRFVRPNTTNVHQSNQYIPSNIPASYASAGPSASYFTQNSEHPVTYIYLTRQPQYPPMYRRFPPQ
jgi:hypothetical protein